MQRLQASLTDLAPSQVISTGRPFDPERKQIMNRQTFSAIALVAAAFAAGQAVAADASSPLFANGEASQVLPVQAAVQGKTREQVNAELAEAIRTGDIVIGGEASAKAHEFNTVQTGQQGKTREQVKAELAEAIRTGDIVVGEGNQTHHWLNTQRRGRVL